MNEWLSLLGIASALAVGAVGAGPGFVVVARTAFSAGRAQGVATAFGIALAGAIFAMVALLGLHSVLLAVPKLFIGLKLFGGAYLLYLGVRIIRGATQPLTVDASNRANASRSRSLLNNGRSGFITQIVNPKTAIVYASVFAAFLPAHTSGLFNLATVCVVFMIELIWYVVVSLLLSTSVPRAAYLHHKKWLDRIAGGVMAALGGKLLTSALR